MKWLTSIMLLFGVAIMEHVAQRIYAVSRDVNDLRFFAAIQLFLIVGGAVSVWCDWEYEAAKKRDIESGYERFRTWWK